jgi:transcriptional regulator GlxA family with amidase domain
MKAAFVIFDQMTSLDFIGIYDPVTRLKTMNIMPDFSWSICSVTEKVTDDRNLVIQPDCVGQSLSPYDVLIVPGGYGTRALYQTPEFVDWIKTARQAELKVSVCTGALLLGAAGFLKNKRATTHPGALEELEAFCSETVRSRIVDQGRVITGGGVTAGIDVGLYVVERVAGIAARKKIASQMDYPYYPGPGKIEM